jgi:predicted lysophospholipase L1 biosynthesis ABC-type transport system permease subunit
MLFQEPRTPDEANFVDEESGESRNVRIRLGDAVTVRLAGRNVADGRTDAMVSGWD